MVTVVTSCRKQLVDSFDFVSVSTEPSLLVGKQPPILFLNVELGRIRQAEAGAVKGRLNHLSRHLCSVNQAASEHWSDDSLKKH